MSDQERYASVPERITWTTGFRLAIDKHVLGVLSTFANFRTGKHADMKLDTLAARAKVPKRTLLRALQRLEDDKWISGRHRHRRPTIYDIDEARLATHWMEAKLVAPLSATGGTQDANLLKTLSAMGGAQDLDLSAMGGTQEPILSATGGTPSPVRTDPLLVLDHKEPALRAVDTNTEHGTEAKVAASSRPHQLALHTLADVNAPTAPPRYDATQAIEAIRKQLTGRSPPALESAPTTPERKTQHGG